MRVALAVVALAAVGCSSETPLDLVLRGGLVLDGTPNPGVVADVGVRGGRIVAVGNLDGHPATRVLDVRGRAVAPGFVDMHSHADLVLLTSPERRARLLEAKLRQGVTTILVGNCGLGVAPATDGAAEILAAINGWMTPADTRAGPLSVRGYLDRLEASGVPLNVATLVPHGPLRMSTVGPLARTATTEEVAAMQEILGAALAEGAYGLSVGLIYPPGMHADTAELVELARVVAAAGGLFTAHVRGSSETLLRATDELIEIGRESGVRVHHSHLEAVGERFWPLLDEVLAREARARADGLEIAHDLFPYTRAATMMSAIFPPWSLEGGVDGLLSRLAEPAVADRIRSDIERRASEWPPWEAGRWPHNLVGAVGWDAILVASLGGRADDARVGRSLASLAEGSGETPFDVVAQLMLDEHGKVGQLVGEISGTADEREWLMKIFRDPAGAIVSDAEDYGHGVPHPAHAGAFARALRLARETGATSPESLVHRMTALPAARIGLGDRGRIAPGYAADLVVLELERVTDRATWDAPRRFAAGFDWVIVNGTVVVSPTTYTPSDAGDVLRFEPALEVPQGGPEGSP